MTVAMPIKYHGLSVKESKTVAVWAEKSFLLALVVRWFLCYTIMTSFV
jgi:hypothetical protein